MIHIELSFSPMLLILLARNNIFVKQCCVWFHITGTYRLESVGCSKYPICQSNIQLLYKKHHALH